MAGEWYDRAEATYITLVDEHHRISSLFNLVNVPSAVWIDEEGRVLRIDEGAYAMKHTNGDFEFGREDYAPRVIDWARRGSNSEFATATELPDLALTDNAALAEANFMLGVYFMKAGDEAKASRYWSEAQALVPDSWNYHRQDWSFGSQEKASANWLEKFQSLEGKPYYRPIEALDAN